jgi:hypothetical protein
VRLADISSLARSIDPRYPTVGAILALSLVVAVGGASFQLFQGASLQEALPWGVSAGLAVFLAWALGRELDPDHELSAFVGAGLSLAGRLLFGAPALLALAWMLLALRLVNRTTGLPAKIQDSLGLLGLGLWLTWQESWVYGLATTMAFFLDSRLFRPQPRHLGFAVLALLGTLGLTVVQGTATRGSWQTTGLLWAIVAATLLFVLIIPASSQLNATGDATGEPLRPPRLQAAQILALLTALFATAWSGEAGVIDLLPLWAAMLGTPLYWLAASLVGRR